MGAQREKRAISPVVQVNEHDICDLVFEKAHHQESACVFPLGWWKSLWVGGQREKRAISPVVQVNEHDICEVVFENAHHQESACGFPLGWCKNHPSSARQGTGGWDACVASSVEIFVDFGSISLTVGVLKVFLWQQPPKHR